MLCLKMAQIVLEPGELLKHNSFEVDVRVYSPVRQQMKLNVCDLKTTLPFVSLFRANNCLIELYAA